MIVKAAAHDQSRATGLARGAAQKYRTAIRQKLAGGRVHKLPEDFRKAIDLDVAARKVWADLAPLARNEWICWDTSADQDATRKRRMEAGIDKMRGGMRRPCCWARMSAPVKSACDIVSG